MPNNTVYNNRASSNIVYLFGAVNSGQPQEDDCCCPFSVVENREDLALISDPQDFDVTFIQNGTNGGIDVAIFLGGQWIIKSLKGAKGDKGEKGDTGDKGERGEAGQNGLNGATGQTGRKPKHRWDGTKLQFELPDGSWGTLVDLRGQDGTNGTNGTNGAKGDKPNHEWSGTELRFELPNGTWGVSVDLRGERGEKGDFPAHEWSATNEIRFQNPDGSWGAWQNIRGEKGDDGQNGIDGLPGTNGVDGLAPEHEVGSDNRSIRFKNPDGSWGAWVVLTSDLIDNGVVYFDYLGLELPASPVAGQMWYMPTYNKFYEYGVDWVVEASPVRNKIYYYTPTNTLYARDENTGSLTILAQVVTKTSQLKNDGEFGVDKYLEVGQANITYQQLSEKGVPNGYVPLDSLGKVLSSYLDIVTDLGEVGTNRILSLEAGKYLKAQIDAINDILASDDINLDTLQEIIIAIKEIDVYLNAILVNDLTSGGTTKALTAEMGKLLQNNKTEKVTTSGVERVYTINPDGSQATKPTSDFKDVLEFANFASFPTTGEIGKIYLALDIKAAYYWSGSAYVQIGGNEYLKKDIATYPIASFPLADTDKLLLWQGGVPKKLDKSDLYKQTTITVELMTNLTSDFYAPNDLIIHSTDIIRGSGTITLKVENVAYTLGQLITRGNKITVETTTPSVYNLNTTPTNTNWQRPSDWLPMPTNITATDQTFVGLHAVIENSDNYCAFSFTTSAGQYQVDWGDGNVTLHNSNTIAQHQYNYASVSNSTLSTRGYKQAIVKVTPVSGNLLTCNFQQRFVTTPVQNQAYSSGFLECILSMPNASSGLSITLGGTTVRHTYCEKVDIKTIGNATSLTNLFYNFQSLKSIPLFDTINVTDMQAMLFNCYSLQLIPLFNTINVTNMAGMLTYCYSLQFVPLFNTINVTNMSNMLAFCHSLQFVPLFNTINVTNMAGMLFNCYPLNLIPAFITTAVTSNFTSFANGCNSINRILMSFNRTVALQNCQLSKDALVEIFTNLTNRTATTSATIDITGNWGASALTSADRLIATNKNWVITG